MSGGERLNPPPVDCLRRDAADLVEALRVREGHVEAHHRDKRQLACICVTLAQNLDLDLVAYSAKLKSTLAWKIGRATPKLSRRLGKRSLVR